jgi:transcriptional regulator with XRE-family HTH domain
MSSVPHVAGSGEVSSLELFSCRIDSPPVRPDALSPHASSLNAPPSQPLAGVAAQSLAADSKQTDSKQTDSKQVVLEQRAPAQPTLTPAVDLASVEASVEAPAAEWVRCEAPVCEFALPAAGAAAGAAPAATRRLATAAEVAAAASALAVRSLRRAIGEVPAGPCSGEQPLSVRPAIGPPSNVRSSRVQDAKVQSVTAARSAPRSDIQAREDQVSQVEARSKQRKTKGDSRFLGEQPAKKSADATAKPGLHRIAKIREQQGISERTMARRLDMDVKRYRELENPQSDLCLSQVIAIQTALEVPICDLLEDRQGLSRPVEERAKLLKIMKTAMALKEAKINARTDRMAQMLCEQLVDLMPELAEVSGWPQFGARRGASAVGKALQQPIDTSNILFQE